MKKVVKEMGEHKSRIKPILLTILAVLFTLFIIIPLLFSLLSDSSPLGNVARIPIQGVITGDGAGSLGQNAVSSLDIIQFIEDADENPAVKVILLEINSPGGSAVASDEIASAVKRTQKPVIALIREMGASGGYWIASSTDHIIANRMSITGSIGVISSYLEFSKLMEKYGVGYERLVAGEVKDAGTPFRQLNNKEREVLQQKLNTIHDFFIQEVAANRKLSESSVRKIATGEFYLGVEALELGLVDELGDKNTAEEYIKTTYGLDDIEYAVYEPSKGLFDLLSGVFTDFSFHIGQGIGASFQQQQGGLIQV
ncbi:MAG: signal peptide peptidase SppA [Nanoarchaeota archaeon]|nr:signal peptide peptidase SppA [Nanoarchaeota archaeon]